MVTDTRDGLILFSHGSVLCGAGQALAEHAQRLRERGDFAAVEVGYLNYSEPPFQEAVARCAAQGVTRLFIVPYFLVPGKFVKVDLPARIAEARTCWPNLTFVTAPPLGEDDVLADALLELAARARASDFWRDDLHRAAAFCRAHSECPLYGTPNCPKDREEGRGKREEETTREEIEGKREERTATPQHPNTSTPQHPSTATPAANSSLFPLPSSLVSALLVLIHGTPRPVANEPMFRVVANVRERGVYPVVEVGFLECNEPDIPTAIAACIRQGAEEIVAVPYFLHTGKHVADDLPTLLESAQARYPHVAFRLSDFLGRAPQITDLLARRVQEVKRASRES